MTYLICIANDYTQIVNQEEQFTPEQQEVKQWAENLKNGINVSTKGVVSLLRDGRISEDQFIEAYKAGIGATPKQGQLIQEVYVRLCGINETNEENILQLNGQSVTHCDLPNYLNFDVEKHPDGFPEKRFNDFLKLLYSVHHACSITLESMMRVAGFWPRSQATHITFENPKFSVKDSIKYLKDRKAFPNLESITVCPRIVAKAREALAGSGIKVYAEPVETLATKKEAVEPNYA